MYRPRFGAKRSLPAVVTGGALLLMAALAFAPGQTYGQATPTARPTFAPAATTAPAAPVATVAAPRASPPAAFAPSSQAAPAIDNELAVRYLLPEDVKNNDRLPGKYARADLPNAPGGYVVFISTIYRRFDAAGNLTYWLLVNDLQWDSGQWYPGVANYDGVQLTSDDDLYLAINLTDISAIPDPVNLDVSVAYSASGSFSPSFSRDERLIEIYDITLTTIWSRDDYIRDVDSSNGAYVIKHAEDVDWNYGVVDGASAIIANVTDTDVVTATGVRTLTSDDPVSGTTKTTEVWKWDGTEFQFSGTVSSLPAAPRTPAAPRASATPSPTPRPAAPTTAPAAPTRTPAPGPSATATRGPSG